MTRRQAVKLYDSGFWEEMTLRDIVTFQLFEERLCMPFRVFHAALEETLNRPVFTHEFGLNLPNLKKELCGVVEGPTPEEIISLIPKEKRIAIFGGD